MWMGMWSELSLTAALHSTESKRSVLTSVMSGELRELAVILVGASSLMVMKFLFLFLLLILLLVLLIFGNSSIFFREDNE